MITLHKYSLWKIRDLKKRIIRVSIQMTDYPENSLAYAFANAGKALLKFSLAIMELNKR